MASHWHEPGIRAWTEGVPVDESALQQLRNVASLPFVKPYVAAMPDVHFGLGATVGSVIPTEGAIIPAAVGVDIGCGMKAVRTSLTASDLPDNLNALRSAIEAAVPHGRTDQGRKNDCGAWGGGADCRRQALARARGRLPRHRRQAPAGAKQERCAPSRHARHRQPLHRGVPGRRAARRAPEGRRVWFLLHSGSRGPGNRIGTYFISRAKEEMVRAGVSLPDQDCSASGPVIRI